MPLRKRRATISRKTFRRISSIDACTYARELRPDVSYHVEYMDELTGKHRYYLANILRRLNTRWTYLSKCIFLSFDFPTIPSLLLVHARHIILTVRIQLNLSHFLTPFKNESFKNYYHLKSITIRYKYNTHV